MSPVTKAVIPIAGLGSRFLPATKVIPKEMLPVFDRPVIELIVIELAKAGVTDIIFVVPPSGSITPNHFAKNEWLEKKLREKGKGNIADSLSTISSFVRIHEVIQQQPLGDGHAILQAKNIIDGEDFFAFFGDEILDHIISAPAQLLAVPRKKGECVLGVQRVSHEEVSRFGIVTPKNKNPFSPFSIIDFVEKPKPENAPSNLALLGKNLCSSKIFDALEKMTVSEKGERRLVDAFLYLKKEEIMTGCILEGKRFDVGNPKGLLAASTYFSKTKKGENILYR